MNLHKENYKLVMAKSPAHPLPDSILLKEKTGFSIPVKEWIMNGNKPLAENVSGSWVRHVCSKIL
jgi:hypothetical protein